MEKTTADVYGKKISVLEGGTGEPLLYLHGAGPDAEWGPCHELLAQRFRLIMPLHPGFGDSQGIEEIDSIEDLALHELDVLDVLGLSRVDVLGVSLGGWLAAELAHRNRERVGKLVLVDAAGLYIREAPIAEMFAAEPKVLAERLFHDQSHPLAMLMRAIDKPNLLPEEVLVPQLRAMAATAKIAWNPYFHNPRLERRLDRIRAATLVIWGRQDGLVPLAHGERYQSRIPGARLHVIDDCGHLPPIEKPEELVRAVASFLQ